MAEIKIERKQRSLLPWILGLVLLVLVIWGVSKVMARNRTGGDSRGAAAADTLRDNTPPRLRQYAQAAGALDEAPSPALRAA